MANQENTAINDLIHGLTERPATQDPAEELTFRPPGHAPQPSHARHAPSLPVAQVPWPGPAMAPLPRRRAPNATPAQVPIEGGPTPWFASDGSDEEPTIVVDRFAQERPAMFALAQPAPLPPAPPPAGRRQPSVADRADGYVPALGPHVHAVISAPIGHPAYPVQVAPMPAGPHALRPTFIAELRQTFARFAIPLGALGLITVVLASYLGLRDRSAHAAPTPVASEIVATPIEAPVVAAAPTAHVDPLNAAPETWKPTVTQPTLTTPTVEPAVEPTDEVAEATDEAAPEVAVKPRSKRTRSARSARRPKVAVAEPARAKRARASKSTKASRRAVVTEASLPRSVANKATAPGGPGKLVVTSNKAALIYIDGRSTNLMTPKKITLPAGSHKITLLELDQRKAKTQTVEITSGKVSTIDKRF